MDLGTRYYGSPGPKTFVEIPRGAGIMHIAALLGEAGVLRHRLPFVVYVRWAGKSRSLKAGEYLFHSSVASTEERRSSMPCTGSPSSKRSVSISRSTLRTPSPELPSMFHGTPTTSWPMLFSSTAALSLPIRFRRPRFGTEGKG